MGRKRRYFTPIQRARRREPGVYPEVCSICDYRFRLPEHLDQHERETSRHDNWGYNYTFRSYSFATSSSPSYTPRSGLDSDLRFHSSPFPLASYSSNSVTDFKVPSFLRKMSSSTELNRFIDNKLQPDQDVLDDCGKVVDDLVRCLQRTHFNVAEVIKGGSFGKGTAVKGRADLDCLLMLNDFESQEDFYDKMKGGFLGELRKEIKRTRLCRSGKLEIEDETPFALKLKYHDGFDTHDIDLLPIHDNFGITRREFYASMKKMTHDRRQYCSASLAKLQVKFVKRQHPLVKNLIRLVKYWRKKSFKESTSASKRLPSSYPLELITIHTWQKYSGREDFNMKDMFKKVMLTLCDPDSIQIQWSYYYDPVNYYGCAGYDNPFIRDPANPFNNVATSCNTWDLVAKAAKQSLLQRLFQ